MKNSHISQRSEDLEIPIVAGQVDIIAELANLDMREIGKVEDIQKLIAKSTSSDKTNLKNLSHHYSHLRKLLQKKLKDQDIEKLEFLKQ